MKAKKIIVLLLSVLISGAVGYRWANKNMQKTVDRFHDLSDKHLKLYLMMNQWVNVKLQKKNIASYLEQRGIKDIAIYGLSYVGETLIEELQDSNICICYGIDREAEYIHQDFEVLSPDMDLDKVDAVIVTTITYFDEIKEQLRKQMDCPVISLEQLLDDL